MKPLIYNDILSAVACISGQDNPDRAISDLIRAAETADAHRRLHFAPHPRFGDGSLMAAALRFGRHGDASFRTPTGRSAWISVLTALQRHLS